MNLKDLDKLMVNVNGKIHLPANIIMRNKFGDTTSMRSGYALIPANQLLNIYYENKARLEMLHIANENIIDIIRQAMPLKGESENERNE